MRVVDERDRGRLDLAVALDVDLVVVVDHDLGDRVVAKQGLERPVAEDVIRDLARDLAPFLAGQRGAVDRELLGDDAQHLLGQVVGGGGTVLGPAGGIQLRAELGDARVVDVRLQVGVRVRPALDRLGLVSDEREGIATRAVRRAVLPV